MPNERDVKRLIRTSVALYIINAVLIVIIGGLLFIQQVEAKNDLQDRIKAGQAYRYQACRATEDVKTVLRDNTEESIASTEQYLKDNPQGIPGIPRSLIIKGLEKNHRTVEKLAPIDCQKVALS